MCAHRGTPRVTPSTRCPACCTHADTHGTRSVLVTRSRVSPAASGVLSFKPLATVFQSYPLSPFSFIHIFDCFFQDYLWTRAGSYLTPRVLVYTCDYLSELFNEHHFAEIFLSCLSNLIIQRFILLCKFSLFFFHEYRITKVLSISAKMSDYKKIDQPLFSDKMLIIWILWDVNIFQCYEKRSTVIFTWFPLLLQFCW